MTAAARAMCVALASSLGRPASVAHSLPLTAPMHKVREVTHVVTQDLTAHVMQESVQRCFERLCC